MNFLSFFSTILATHWGIKKVFKETILTYGKTVTQARMQEMKWGCFFVKSGKWGCFVKSGPFLNAGCIMYSISIFILHFTYLGVRTHPTHPLAYGPVTTSSRTQTTEVLFRWKYVRQTVGRALNSLLSARLRYSDTSQTCAEEHRPKRRTLRKKH